MKNDEKKLTKDNYNRVKKAHLFSWFFSNVFNLLFPIGAIFLVEQFKGNDSFTIITSYPEILIVTISICLNLLIQLNSIEYTIDESFNTFIRIITSAILGFSSLAYGISKTIEEKNINNIFTFSLIVLIASIIIGSICEYKRK